MTVESNKFLLVINIAKGEFTASRYNFFSTKRKKEKNFCMYTKLNVYVSWNFIMCNVHKRNKRKNVLKVYIHNLQAFVHTTAAREEVARDGKRFKTFLVVSQNAPCCLPVCDLHWIAAFSKKKKQRSAAQFSFHNKTRIIKSFCSSNFSIAQTCSAALK